MEGIGDGGVPRRMKAMGRAYLGRLKAYDQALAAGDAAALAEAIGRNLFRGAASGSEAVLAAYTLAERRRFQGHDWEAAKAGDLGFPRTREDTGMTGSNFPLSRRADLIGSGKTSLEVLIDASAEERARIAAWLGVPSVESFRADLTLTRWRAHGVAAEGLISDR